MRKSHLVCHPDFQGEQLIHHLATYTRINTVYKSRMRLASRGLARPAECNFKAHWDDNEFLQ